MVDCSQAPLCCIRMCMRTFSSAEAVDGNAFRLRNSLVEFLRFLIKESKDKIKINFLLLLC